MHRRCSSRNTWSEPERTEALPRMFFEPDGSFVWVAAADAETPWQIDGLLSDRAGRLIAAEFEPMHQRFAVTVIAKSSDRHGECGRLLQALSTHTGLWQRPGAASTGDRGGGRQILPATVAQVEQFAGRRAAEQAMSWKYVVN